LVKRLQRIFITLMELTLTPSRCLSLIDLKVGTILGAQLGFEILTREDFASIDHEALWSVMINLFCFRVTFVKWPND
jgi:hypothetical protein